MFGDNLTGFDEGLGQDPTQVGVYPEDPSLFTPDPDPVGPSLPEGLVVEWSYLENGTPYFVVPGEGGGAEGLLLDMDDDGQPDVILERVDGGFHLLRDGDLDGIFESEEYYTDAEMAEQQPDVYTFFGADLPVVAEPATPTVDDGRIVGDPWAFGDDWFQQAFNGSCLPAAVATIFREYTGTDVNDADFIQLANELGVWIVGPDGVPGIAPESAELLLDEAGVGAEYLSGQTVDDLLGYLSEPPHAVMVSVDSSVIWEGRGADGMDHVVLVTGIDPQAGIVYLSDSGTPDGNQLEVDLDTFLESWSQGGNEIIVAEQSAEEFRTENQVSEGVVAQPAVDPATQLPESTPVGQPPATPAVDFADTLDGEGVLPGSLLPVQSDPLTDVATWVSQHAWVLVPVVLGAGAVIARAATHKDS